MMVGFVTNARQHAPDPVFDTAWQVSAHLLEVTRVALVTGDADAYVQRFDLPSEVGTDFGVRMLERRADVLDVFDSVRRQMALVAAVDLKRVVTSARFFGADTMHSTFESTWVLPMGKTATTFGAEGIAVLRDGLWRIKASHYDAGELPLLMRALTGRWN